MLHSYFYMPASGNGNQNIDDQKEQANFMHMYDADHSTITCKPYLAVEQHESENTEADNSDFISFYDIFGAVNY